MPFGTANAGHEAKARGNEVPAPGVGTDARAIRPPLRATRSAYLWPNVSRRGRRPVRLRTPIGGWVSSRPREVTVKVLRAGFVAEIVGAPAEGALGKAFIHGVVVELRVLHLGAPPAWSCCPAASARSNWFRYRAGTRLTRKRLREDRRTAPGDSAHEGAFLWHMDLLCTSRARRSRSYVGRACRTLTSRATTKNPRDDECLADLAFCS